MLINICISIEATFVNVIGSPHAHQRSPGRAATREGRHVMDRPGLARRALMEAIGTFVLVTAGCGAIVANTVRPGSLGGVGVSLVFGLVITAMIYAGGHLSGAHYNPSVTIAFTLARHFPLRDALVYVAAQLAGASAAAFVLLAAWTSTPAHLGTTLPSVATSTALLYEIAMSAFLMFVITAVATDTRAVGAAAAIAIGGTVAFDALFGGPITGASMNPARSFGPALASDTWHDLWIYLAGPVIGATIGVFAYRLVRGSQPPSTLSAQTIPTPEGSPVDGECPVRLPA
jgi:aquaporin NIP